MSIQNQFNVRKAFMGLISTLAIMAMVHFESPANAEEGDPCKEAAKEARDQESPDIVSIPGLWLPVVEVTAETNR